MEKVEVLNSTDKTEIPFKEKERDNFKIPSFIGGDDFASPIIDARLVYVNEHWDNAVNISSRVIQINVENVVCECLIDQEKRIFETRSFPKNLFEHLKNLREKPFVLLSLKSRPGSTRIDIYDGNELVDKKEFNRNDEWNIIDSSDFNTPLDSNLVL